MRWSVTDCFSPYYTASGVAFKEVTWDLPCRGNVHLHPDIPTLPVITITLENSQPLISACTTTPMAWLVLPLTHLPSWIPEKHPSKLSLFILFVFPESHCDVSTVVLGSRQLVDPGGSSSGCPHNRDSAAGRFHFRFQATLLNSCLSFFSFWEIWLLGCLFT